MSETIKQAIEAPKTVEPAKPGKKELFRFAYKIGNIHREEFIKAEDIDTAKASVARYLRFLQKDNFSKVVPSGPPKPFAIDIDQLIVDYNERMKREGNAPYIENTNAPVLAGIKA